VHCTKISLEFKIQGYSSPFSQVFTDQKRGTSVIVQNVNKAMGGHGTD